MLILYTILACGFLYCLYLHIKKYFERRKYRHIPSYVIPLRWDWYIGNANIFKAKMQQYGTNHITVFEYMRKELESDTCAFFLLKNFIYTVRLPVISRVISDHDNFKKGNEQTLQYVNGNRLFGHKGLLTEIGTEVWHKKRREMDPAFKKKYLKMFMDNMNNSAKKFCKKIKDKSASDRPVDIFAQMNNVAAEVICTCGFDINDDLTMKRISECSVKLIDTLETYIKNKRAFSIPWKYRAEKEVLKTSISTCRNILKQYLAVRIEKLQNDPGSVSSDILDHIIKGI